MHFLVVPASAQTSNAAIEYLLKHTSSPRVTGVYRDVKKAPANYTYNVHFQAVQGDIADSATLNFTGIDAVLTVLPPRYDGSDFVAFAKQAAKNIRDAATRAGVRRLVYVSSVGAQFDHGVGEIACNHEAEVVLADAAPEVVIVRNAYFMQNWGMGMETLKDDRPHLNSVITPVDHKVPMVSAQDIGEVCAEQLLATGQDLPSKPHTFELWGPREYSPQDVQRAFIKALGHDVELRPVPREVLPSFFGAIMPENIANAFVEMTITMLSGGILDTYDYSNTEVRRGKIELDDAIATLVQERS